MIGSSFKYEDNSKRVADAVDRAEYRNLGHAAASIRKEAIESIESGDGPSLPGTPPHTHTQKLTKKGKVRKGQLPRAIVYDNDKESDTAVIGPRESVVGTSGEAHEFGGDYKGQDFPERPFMGPALDKNIDRFASSFAGSIGE